MANRKISILDSFLSGGRVGSSFRSSAKATLKASTRILSLVAWAVLYFWVALRRRRRSSLLSAPISLFRSLKVIVDIDSWCWEGFWGRRTFFWGWGQGCCRKWSFVVPLCPPAYSWHFLIYGDICIYRGFTVIWIRICTYT